jgi:hypothetical protein
MICPSCGRENTDNSRFCGGCGASLINPGFVKANIYLAALYTIVTSGIYLPYWFLRRLDIINGMHSEIKLKSLVFVLIIILFLISLLTSLGGGIMIGMNYEDLTGWLLYGISNIASVAGIILLVIQAFKLRRIFDDHFNKYLKQSIELSKLGTFLLNSLYFQHKVNELF